MVKWLRRVLETKTGAIGFVVFIIGIIKPVIQIVRGGVDVVSEFQTAIEIWPSVIAWVSWVYQVMPFWLNPLAMIGGVGLMYAASRETKEPPTLPPPTILTKPIVPAATIPKHTVTSVVGEDEWRPLTGADMLGFVKVVKPIDTEARLFNQKIAIKFFATAEGKYLAQPLSEALIALGYNIVVNQDDASYIFPPKPDQQPGITIRHPAGEYMGLALFIDSGLTSARLSSKRVEFPKSDQLNFIQVEIGKRTNASQY